jgi:peptide/nickel transport system permease protein
MSTNVNLGVQAVATTRVRFGGVLVELLRRPIFVVGTFVVLGWTAAPIGVWVFNGDPFGRSGALGSPPSGAHPLGTDSLGRDMLMRVLAGAEPVLTVAPLATLLACVLGGAMGLIAGYRRGIGGDVVMRTFDVVGAVPGVIGVLLVASAFGRSRVTIIIAIGTLFAPTVARTVRAAVLAELGKDYIESAKIQGETTTRILFAELLPNVMPSLVVEGTLRLGYAVFFSAGLSFLGLGEQPPSADWGLAVAENRAYAETAWWTMAFPAIAILTLVVAVNLIADELREVFSR